MSRVLLLNSGYAINVTSTLGIQSGSWRKSYGLMKTVARPSPNCSGRVKRRRRRVSYNAAINRSPIAFIEVCVARDLKPHTNHRVIAEDVCAVCGLAAAAIVSGLGHERRLTEQNVCARQNDFTSALSMRATPIRLCAAVLPR